MKFLSLIIDLPKSQYTIVTVPNLFDRLLALYGRMLFSTLAAIALAILLKTMLESMSETMSEITAAMLETMSETMSKTFLPQVLAL